MPCLCCNAVNRYDPSKTMGLRRSFVADFRRRIKALRSHVYKSVVVDDFFSSRSLFWNEYGIGTDGGEDYDSKIERFLALLLLFAGKSVLQRNNRGHLWSRRHSVSAYTMGVTKARNELESGGYGEQMSVDMLMLLPSHIKQSKILYSRVDGEVETWFTDMSNKIRRDVSDSLIAGDSPRTTYNKISGDISDAGVPAAQIGRTEPVRLAHLASIQTLEEAGVSEVTVLAEYTTMRDGKVCPVCRGYDGKVMTIEAIRYLIPVHPNCRCGYVLKKRRK